MGERMECQTITAGGATSAGNTPMVSASAIKGASVSCNLAGCDGKCGICTPAPMPTERMEEVEVVCGMCQGEGTTEGYPGYAPQGGPDGARYECFVCLAGTKTITATVKPGSLTAARLRLADAAEALSKFPQGFGRCSPDHEAAIADYTAALAALRTARGEG